MRSLAGWRARSRGTKTSLFSHSQPIQRRQPRQCPFEPIGSRLSPRPSTSRRGNRKRSPAAEPTDRRRRRHCASAVRQCAFRTDASSCSRALVNTASLLIANTLRNISSPEQIPNKLNYQIEYDDTVPQRYLLEQQRDIAELLNRLPADGIISFTATPLPEPSRPDKPIEPQRCTVGQHDLIRKSSISWR